jgi:hypothetical protein
MIPNIHNSSLSPDSLLVDGVTPPRLRHHHGHKLQSININSTTTDTCYCVPFV